MPFESLGRTTHVRSTLVATSIQMLKARGHYSSYEALLTDEDRQGLAHCIVGEWLPIGTAMLHYRTCDRLGMSADEQSAMGREVARRIHETFLGLVVRMARGVGVTPWALLAKGNALHSRVLRGGGTQVTRLGPTRARAEVAGLGLLSIPYFMNGLQGTYESMVELFAKRASARVVLPESRVPHDRTIFDIDWQ